MRAILDPPTSTSTAPGDPAGLRVLVVEDEAAISMLLEDMLLDLGCTVIGPAGRLAQAGRLMETESFDLAILDVNVAGEPVYPLADRLVAEGKIIVFSTGYGASGIEERFRDRPVLQKPFAQSDLERVLKAAAG